MGFTIQVFEKNSNFSQEFADATYNGQESPENTRFEWEDDFRINNDIDDVKVVRDTTYLLAGERGEGDTFAFEIPGVTIFEFHGEEGVTPVVFSESALDEYELDLNRKKLTVYLNDTEVIENPIPGIYIVLSRFPKELQG